jgi:hypothetical protein
VVGLNTVFPTTHARSDLATTAILADGALPKASSTQFAGINGEHPSGTRPFRRGSATSCLVAMIGDGRLMVHQRHEKAIYPIAKAASNTSDAGSRRIGLTNAWRRANSLI